MTDPAAPDLAIVELKPCPFCGSDWLKPCQTQNVHWVVCPRCDAEGPVKKSAANAIAAWNTRADSPEGAQCIEMLVAALDETHAWVRRIQDVMTGYLVPDGYDEAEVLSRLIEMLDGPEQREIQGRSFAALAKVRGR